MNDEDLCLTCQSGEVNLDATYSYGWYDGSLRGLINLFKYGKVETLAPVLARFASKALPLDCSFDLIVGMPMHWRKKRQRGFNQADLLARRIGQRLGLKPAQILRRTRLTKAQASLTEAQRKRNLHKSFQVTHPELVAGKRILLVDDVMTTGSTLREVTKVLRAAGARSVSGLTVARVDHPRWSPGASNKHSNSLLALQQGLADVGSRNPTLEPVSESS